MCKFVLSVYPSIERSGNRQSQDHLISHHITLSIYQNVVIKKKNPFSYYEIEGHRGFVDVEVPFRLQGEEEEKYLHTVFHQIL